MDKLFDSKVAKDMDDLVLEEDEEMNYSNQMTPQNIIDRLSRYTVRKNGAYSTPDCFCGLCFNVYNVGDRIACLPCHHNFHEYCIENWLKWVKPSCPIDKKGVTTHYQYNLELAKEREKRAFESTSQTRIGNLVRKGNTTVSISSSSDDVAEPSYNDLHDKCLNVSISKSRCKGGKASHKRNSGALAYPSFHKSVQGEGLDIKVIRHGAIGMKDGKNSPGMTIANAIQIDNYDQQGKHKREKSRKSDCLFSTLSKLQNHTDNKIRMETEQCKYPSQFDKELEILLSQLTCLDSFGKKTKPFKANRGFTNPKLNFLPCKKKKFETSASLRGIMGGRGITFGEMLEIEREDNCGWMYKSDWSTPCYH